MSNLLCILMNFPIALLYVVGHLPLEVMVILYPSWVQVVSVGSITSCTTLVIGRGSALEVHVVILHVNVPL